MVLSWFVAADGEDDGKCSYRYEVVGRSYRRVGGGTSFSTVRGIATDLRS